MAGSERYVLSTSGLSISSTPEGAAVTIDGNSAGTTPLNQVLLTAGTHTIVLKLAGYQDYTASVTLTNGKNAAVMYILTPVCPSGYSCMAQSSAIQKWGANGYDQYGSQSCGATGFATDHPVAAYCYRQRVAVAVTTTTPVPARVPVQPASRVNASAVQQVNPCSALGKTDCNGQCIDVTSDNQNCGACGNDCRLPQTCQNGTCTLDCPIGQADCQGGCQDVLSDIQNCGACGNTCSSGMKCSEGTCVCPDGLSKCDEGCVNLQQDPKNCGNCGISCPAGSICKKGACFNPADQDGDGIPDDQDNCRFVPNHDQSVLGTSCLVRLTDKNYFLPETGWLKDPVCGVACMDYDNDGILDPVDNCPMYYNPTQIDSDLDGIGDSCEYNHPFYLTYGEVIYNSAPLNNFSRVLFLDMDGDGVMDWVDNCPKVFNPEQWNSDNSGTGDACSCSNCESLSVTPVLMNGNADQKVDIVLAPDPDYGGDMKQFHMHVVHMITNGFNKTDLTIDGIPVKEYGNYLQKFNIYTTPLPVDVEEGSFEPLDERFEPTFTAPCGQFTNLYSYAEAFGVLHQEPFRDWAGQKCFKKVFTAGDPNVLVHETGHAIYGLKDEYGEDDVTHYAAAPNIFQHDSDMTMCNYVRVADGALLEQCSNYCRAFKGNCGMWGYDKFDSDHCAMNSNELEYGTACSVTIMNALNQYP